MPIKHAVRKVGEHPTALDTSMSFNLQKIVESKRHLHHNLAARPVAEKLRMLDALRERELAIRGRSVHSDLGG